MHQKIRGLVIKSVNYKEADQILSVLSHELGRVSVGARGSRRKSSRLGPATGLFCYADMVLFAHGGKLRLSEAEVLEPFSGLSKSLDGMALACYFADILATEAEGQAGPDDVLRLTLNCLHMLARQLAPPARVKMVFELRYMALSGYMPRLHKCMVCGAPITGDALLHAAGGSLCCLSCVPRGQGFALSAGAVAAMGYILRCADKQIFSFSLSEAGERQLAAAAEGYLLCKLERNFKTLDFYKSVGE